MDARRLVRPLDPFRRDLRRGGQSGRRRRGAGGGEALRAERRHGGEAGRPRQARSRVRGGVLGLPLPRRDLPRDLRHRASRAASPGEGDDRPLPVAPCRPGLSPPVAFRRGAPPLGRERPLPDRLDLADRRLEDRRLGDRAAQGRPPDPLRDLLAPRLLVPRRGRHLLDRRLDHDHLRGLLPLGGPLGPREALSSEWSAGLVRGLYWALPKTAELGRAIVTLVSDGRGFRHPPPIDPVAVYGTTALFALVALALASWLFSRKDF